MDYFVEDTDIERFTLNKDAWVDLKRKMSYGDQQKLSGSMIKLIGSEIKPTFETDLSNAGILTLRLNIKAWNLAGSDGKIMPITEATIAKLEPSIAERIKREIDKRNPFPKA